MIHAIVNIETGELLSLSQDTPVVSGYPLQVRSFSDMTWPVDMTRYAWESNRLAFVARTNRTLTKVAYLRLFTDAERIAIRAAAKSNPVLEDYMAMMELAEHIDLDDPATNTAVHLLENIGMIGVGRAEAILNG